MNARHHSGPWVTEQPEGKSYAWVSSSDGASGDLATVWRDNGNALANARLMAAAPDLLEALRELLSAVQRSVCENSGPAQDSAITAIAKATGQGE